METWMLADVDQIIRDFMDQLRTATEQGWHESRPAHYRAIVAALESALRERHQRRLSQARAGVAPEVSKPERSEVSTPLLFPWAWRPVPTLVPVPRGQS